MLSDAQPLAAIEDDGRYTLSSRADVLFMLTQLLRRGELFTVYFNSGRDFVLTSILDVDGDQERLVFDLGSDRATNQRLLQAERLVFVAAPDGIRVQFVTTGPQLVQFGERDAIASTFPVDIVKLQRRDTFRVEAPHRNPLQLVIPQGPKGRTVLKIRNLSVGGAGVELVDPQHSFNTFERYFDVHIDLRETGRIYSDVQIRHITSNRLRHERTQTIMGLQFVTLSKVDQAKLQRFLVYLERERRQLSL